MATKQNMYVGKAKEVEKVIEKINNCIVMWQLDDDIKK